MKVFKYSSIGMAFGIAGMLVNLVACGADTTSGDDDSTNPGDDDSSIGATSPTPTAPPTPSPTPVPTPVTFAETLYVAQTGTLVAFDIASGNALPGSVATVDGPVGMMALADGTIIVDLSTDNQVLVADGRTVSELSREVTTMGGIKPSDSYLSPSRNDEQYLIALNDGSSSDATTNTAMFIDTSEGSATYRKLAGEVKLGIGHHAVAYSATQERVLISNFNDCDNIMSVYDYSDISSITTVETLSALEAGFDGSTTATTCDVTQSAGVAMKPHGCATSLANGKVYCNMTGVGDLVIADIDAAAPTFKVVKTSGTGGGYTKAGEGGAYLYTVQSSPREGSGGVNCQVGQLLTIEAATDTIVSTVPMLYKGPTCTEALTGTDEATAGPSKLMLSQDGRTLFVSLAGGFSDSTARVRQLVAYDLTVPEAPVQLPSIPIGTSGPQRGMALTGDGKYLFIADDIDNTVTQIDVATLQVTRTLKMPGTPMYLATWGSAEGPGYQVGLVH